MSRTVAVGKTIQIVPTGDAIKVAILSHYPLFTELLCHYLSTQRDMQVLPYVRDPGNVKKRKCANPGVLVVDTLSNKKDTLDLVKRIARSSDAQRVLILMEDMNDTLALRSLRAGAQGCLPRSSTLMEFLKAIRTVFRTGVYLPMEFEHTLARKYLWGKFDSTEDEKLTDREYQVMRHLSLGCTNKEIARLLNISVKTVDTHRGNILRKLELRNNVDITRYALHRGHVTLNEID